MPIHSLPQRPRVYLSGAASGLGRALALNLAPRGARLLVTDRNEEGAQRVAEEARALGAEAYAAEVDVTDPAAVEAAAVAMETRFGGVDLVVNNAGVACAGPVGEATLEDWRWAMDVNLWGVIHGCHAFVPRLRLNPAPRRLDRRGAILNVASCAGLVSIPEMGPYNVGKAGVVALSETLHGELAAARVHVSVLCPTFFPTGLLNTLRAPGARHRRAAEAMFARATATAESVARDAIEGLEAGALHVIPQLDGRALWALKRLAPGLYHRAVAAAWRRGLPERLTQR
jgi:NAD(P)-dependent dehydrogenase (short-subunit alcohol dehydrogenase family)